MTLTLTYGPGPGNRAVIEGNIRDHRVITVYDSTGTIPLYRVHTIAVEVPPDDPVPHQRPVTGSG